MGRRSYSDHAFSQAVASNTNMADTLRALGLKASGGNYTLAKMRIKRWGLDVSHWRMRVPTSPKRQPKKALSQILVRNSTYTDSTKLKKRLVREGLLTYECSGCGISSWRGNSLSLHLDHINGVRDDHRLENLRLLCPNCHSQTETYCGRNKKVSKKPSLCPDCKTPKSPTATRCRQCAFQHRYRQTRNDSCSSCPDCQGTKSPQSTRCKSCDGKLRLLTASTKIQWPPIDELRQMVRNSSFRQVGKLLGVSDNAVRKHIRKRS